MSTNATDKQAPLQVSLPGGTTRVDFYNREHAPDNTPHDAVRGGVDDGSSFRMHADGRIEQFGGVTRHSVADDFTRHADDVLSTARTAWGTRAQAITGDSVIDVLGTSMKVKTAVAMGYLKADGNGYAETAKLAAEKAAAQRQGLQVK